MKFYRSHILIGVDDSSIQHGVKEIETTLREELAKAKLADEYNILETGTLGYFGTGVSLTIYPEQVTYINVTQNDVNEIVQEHF